MVILQLMGLKVAAIMEIMHLFSTPRRSVPEIILQAGVAGLFYSRNYVWSTRPRGGKALFVCAYSFPTRLKLSSELIQQRHFNYSTDMREDVLFVGKPSSLL